MHTAIATAKEQFNRFNTLVKKKFLAKSTKLRLARLLLILTLVILYSTPKYIEVQVAHPSHYVNNHHLTSC